MRVWRFDILAGAMALLLAGAAHGQTWLEPPSELGPDNMAAQTPSGTVLLGLVGTYPDFVEELEAWDVLGVIGDGATDPDVQERPKDLVIGIFDTWDQAIMSYRFLGFDAMATQVERNAPPADGLVTGGLVVLDGQTTVLLTFQRSSADGVRNDRCIARYVVDMVYRGFQNTEISVGGCTNALAAAQ